MLTSNNKILNTLLHVTLEVTFYEKNCTEPLGNLNFWRNCVGQWTNLLSFQRIYRLWFWGTRSKMHGGKLLLEATRRSQASPRPVGCASRATRSGCGSWPMTVAEAARQRFSRLEYTSERVCETFKIP